MKLVNKVWHEQNASEAWITPTIWTSMQLTCLFVVWTSFEFILGSYQNEAHSFSYTICMQLIISLEFLKFLKSTSADVSCKKSTKLKILQLVPCMFRMHDSVSHFNAAIHCLNDDSFFLWIFALYLTMMILDFQGDCKNPIATPSMRVKLWLVCNLLNCCQDVSHYQV